MRWSDFSAILLDLDGTVYHEETPLPGGAELVRAAREMNKTVAFVSNSNASPARIVERLRSMDIHTDAAHVFTAAAAACDVVAQRYSSPRIFNLATDSIYELLQGRATFIESPDDACDAVVIGTPVSRHAHPDRQRIALVLARNGAELIGVCADRMFPSPRGLEFGAGALSAMLAFALNKPVFYCGKPEKIFFQNICDHLQLRPDQCVLAGDNVEADVFGAKRVGMKTILTFTGLARQADVAHLPADHTPDAVADSLAALLETLSA